MDTKISITNAQDDPAHKLAVVEVAFPDNATGVVYNTIKFSFRMAGDLAEDTNAAKQRALATARELAQQFAGVR
jgi:hypothetical protein